MDEGDELVNADTDKGIVEQIDKVNEQVNATRTKSNASQHANYALSCTVTQMLHSLMPT